MASRTFRLNLETADLLKHSQPVAPSDAATNFKNTRSSWLPTSLNNNINLKDGDTFTVTSISEIVYLTNNYTTGSNPPLEIVTP